MDARRFEALLDLHGARMGRWPAADREAAEAFARTREGQALLQNGLELEAWLDASRAPQPSHALGMRVLADAPKPPTWRGSVARWAQAWAPSAGLVAAGLAGVLIGAAYTDAGSDTRAETLLAEAGVYDETVMTLEEAL